MKRLDWLAHSDGLAFVPQVRHDPVARPEEGGYSLSFQSMGAATLQA